MCTERTYRILIYIGDDTRTVAVNYAWHHGVVEQRNGLNGLPVDDGCDYSGILGAHKNMVESQIVMPEVGSQQTSLLWNEILGKDVF